MSGSSIRIHVLICGGIFAKFQDIYWGAVIALFCPTTFLHEILEFLCLSYVAIAIS